MINNEVVSDVDSILRDNDNSIGLNVAIAYNNYERALELNQTFLEEKKLSDDNDIINILLRELIGLDIEENVSISSSDVNNWYEEIKKYVDLILSDGTSLDEAKKRYSFIGNETILLIKLEYARRCLESGTEDSLNEGRMLITEVEAYGFRTDKIDYLFDIIYGKDVILIRG